MLHSRPHQVVWAGIAIAGLTPTAIALGMLAADAWRAVTGRGRS